MTTHHISPAISQAIKQSARELGFDLTGIAGVGDYQELAKFPDWIDQGRAGEMEYLAARNETGDLKRASLQNAAPWAKSVIVVAINYNSDQPYSTDIQDPTRGWISRYAWSERDYHDVILPKLRILEARIAGLAKEDGQEFRSWCYVDTGPVVERVYAKYAGVGWIGKNTCILNQELGSWLFLGVILTSLPLQPDLPAPDRCGTCTRCLDACPTNAFPAPYELDPTRCIAYLTIEKKGAIPEDLRQEMGRHIFGCDICQDVCPWNSKSPAGTEPGFAPHTEFVNPALDWLASLDADGFREAFRKSPIKRAKLNGVRRNVVTAMGNSGRLEFASTLRKLAEDEDPAVAEHARWALQRLERQDDDAKSKEAK
jgi:epoxyqueuosine reductase